MLVCLSGRDEEEMKGGDEEVRGRGFVGSESGGRRVLSFAVGLENRGWGGKEGYGRMSFIKLIGGVLIVKVTVLSYVFEVLISQENWPWSEQKTTSKSMVVNFFSWIS